MAENPDAQTARPKSDWTEVFLATLSEHGHIGNAAKAAGVARRTVYNRKDADPAFADAWEAALDLAADALEDALRSRALDSTDKASHLLLMFALKGLRPERYREFDVKKIADAIEQARRDSKPDAPGGAAAP